MIFLSASLFFLELREAYKLQMRNQGVDSAVLFQGKTIDNLIMYFTMDWSP